MSEDLCPNCRTKRSDEDAPCRQCGWMPLRSTEMRFVDDRAVSCPVCQDQQSVTKGPCPRCHQRNELESLSRHTSVMHVSDLLLLTTLFAVCIAALRVSFALGVFTFVVFGLATFRSVLLIGERKRHRYPLSFSNRTKLFGASLTGVLVASFVFGIALLTCGLLFAAFCTPLINGPQWSAVLMAILLILVMEVGAIIMVGQRGGGVRLLLVGAAAAWAAGLLILFVVQITPWRYFELVLLMLLAAVGLPALWLASRRGGAMRAQSFVVGFSAGLCLLGGISFMIVNDGLASSAASAYGISGVLIWPTLLSTMTLEQMWSWDDAFPNVASHSERILNGQQLTNRPRVLGEEDSGIEFSDVSSQDTPARPKRPEHHRKRQGPPVGS